MNTRSFLWFFLFFTLACTKEPIAVPEGEFYFKAITINDIKDQFSVKNVPLNTKLSIKFSVPLDTASIKPNCSLMLEGQSLPFNYLYKDSTLFVEPKDPLKYLSAYVFEVKAFLKSAKQKNLGGIIRLSFSTTLDESDKLPRLPDADLLTLVQKQTFKYFWDYGHPVSGLSRERTGSGDVVTSGGSGFGLMTIPVAIERGFIKRDQGLSRCKTMVDFLKNKTKTYHGVFPHWLNGTTGQTIPFSTKDNGGDLVETSYLMMGLLSIKQYFNGQTPDETQLRADITTLWENVEWDWHTQGQNVLYWHWSPEFNWQMNHKIIGWNEALITYILAAASPTHPIKKEVYTAGWAQNGSIKNGRKYYNTTLPLGPNLGGPLFFAHYTFLGIDPRNLKDSYADYWQQNVNHSLINYNYCVENPKKYAGYSKNCWGLTASDIKNGYSANSPTNDAGFISPTAALSSMPYTPAESMDALRYFYYILGNKTFKEYGFVDAFRLEDAWFADSHLAIDQGPIIVMIENHRSALLWTLLMADKDIKAGLDKLGFGY